jgi:hypothetical protein
MNENNCNVTTKFTKDENGNPFLEFPEEIIEVLRWEEGDDIEVSVFFDRIIFRKVM